MLIIYIGSAWHWDAEWGLILFSSEVVSLGVTLDSKLTWKALIDKVTMKVNKALYNLPFIRV